MNSTGWRAAGGLLLWALTGCASGGPDAESTEPGPLEALEHRAAACYHEGDLHCANATWDSVLARAAESDDVALEPRALTSLALIARWEGHLAEADSLLVQAIALSSAREAHLELARALNARGLVARDRLDLPSAARWFTASLEVAERQGNTAGVARAVGNQGLVHTLLGEFLQARGSFESLRRAGAELADPIFEANGLSNLGMLALHEGDPVGALRWLGQARAGYLAAAYRLGELHVLGQLVTVYAALGEPAAALAAADSALTLARAVGSASEEASVWELLGAIHTDLGDFPRAIGFLDRAVAGNQQGGHRLQEASARRQRALALARLGNLAQARGEAASVLALHRTEGDRLGEIDALVLLAELAEQAGELPAAEDHLRHAQRLAAATDVRSARLAVGLGHARVADAANRPASALAAIADLAGDLALAHDVVAGEALAILARAHERTGDRDSAIAAGRASLARYERTRSRIEPGPLRSTYLAARARAYADLALNLVLRGDVDEAFGVVDQARGQALRDHLTTARAALADRATAGQLLGEELALRRLDRLLSQLDSLDRASIRQRGESGTPPGAEALAAQVALLREEFESALLRRPTGAILGLEHGHDAPATITATQRLLAPGELLIVSQATARGILTFAVTATRDTALILQTRSPDLHNQVRIFRDLVASPATDQQTWRTVGEHLHSILVAPLVETGFLVPGTRLIVVRHGALAYLPLAALPDPSAGQPLGVQYPVLESPSVAAFAVLRRQAPGAPGVAGGPVTAMAPFPEHLPASRLEARTVRRQWPWKSRTIEGRAATERAARQALERGDLVHIASHGVMNAASPMFSRIGLAPGRGSVSADDGRLEVHEVLGLRIQSPLVFLSGCETGLGAAGATNFRDGEDYATLAQAFLHAGAKHVIATLWRVDDEGAAEFATRFYRHLSAAPPPEALSRAQAEMAGHPVYSHPYYWAGYILHGHGRAQPPAARPQSDARGPLHGR